jgi:hypothetical protein
MLVIIGWCVFPSTPIESHKSQERSIGSVRRLDWHTPRVWWFLLVWSQISRCDTPRTQSTTTAKTRKTCNFTRQVGCVMLSNEITEKSVFDTNTKKEEC